MRFASRRNAVALICTFACVRAAAAQELPKPFSQPLSGREEVLVAIVVAMMLCGFISFLLSGRVSERTHVALALLSVLTGGFGLLVLFGGFLYEAPIAAVLILLLLVGLFRLMSQFESGGPKPTPKESKAKSKD
jgi:hypothetical protein